MGLTETQTALARLLTDTALRSAFFAEPETKGYTLGLNAAETEQMYHITAPRADAMARSLQNKRRNEIAKLLPRTAGTPGVRFAPLFRQFAANFVPHGVNKHVEDALAFARFLRQTEEWRTGPAERRAILRYETVWLTLSNRRFAVRYFSHDVRPGAIPEPRPQIVLWLRPTTQANWRVIWLRAPHLTSPDPSFARRGILSLSLRRRGPG